MQALPFSKTDSIFYEEREDLALQEVLNNLSLKKISWDHFLEFVPDLNIVSRITTKNLARTLLHLAVLENRLDVIEKLKVNPILKVRRDVYGLSPLDLAFFLERNEALEILKLSHKFPEDLKSDQIEPLQTPVFESKEDFEEILKTVTKAKSEDKIPAEKIWMGIYFDKEIRNQIHPPISIRPVSNEVGYGIFADKKIPPCTFIGEYTGVIKKRTPRQLKDKKHCLRYTVWESRKNFTIDAEKKGNFTRFFNHSKHPNLGVQSVYWRGLPRMIFLSLKEIPAGGQLTFDYGPIFWKGLSQAPKEFE